MARPDLQGVVIGACGRPGARDRGVAELGFIELEETFRQTVRTATIARWRKAMPEGQRLVLRADRDLTFPRSEEPGAGLLRDTPAVTGAWDRTLAVAEVAEPLAIVLRTPAAFSPTASHRRVLAAAGARLAEALPGALAVWEPRGLWTPEELEGVAADAGFVPAWDPLASEIPEDGDGPAFFRMAGPGGVRNRYAEDDLLDLMDAAQDRSAVLVGFDHPGALRDARRLKELLG